MLLYTVTVRVLLILGTSRYLESSLGIGNNNAIHFNVVLRKMTTPQLEANENLIPRKSASNLTQKRPY